VKELLKSVNICQSYHKNKSGPVFFDSQCILCVCLRPNFATCSMVTQIYKTGSVNLGVPLQKISVAQKHQNFDAISDNFATWSGMLNIFRMQQDVVNRKTALQTASTPIHVHLIWWHLAHKLRKIGPEFPHTQNHIFGRSCLGCYGPWKFHKLLRVTNDLSLISDRSSRTISLNSKIV